MSFSQQAQDTLTPNDVAFRFMIDNNQIVVSDWKVTSGSYGSVGSAEFRMSRKLLDVQGVDIMALAGSSTMVPIGLWVESGSTPLTKIFDGDLMSTQWDMDNDIVTVHARDHAGVLVDQKRILARDAKAVTQALTPLAPGQDLNPTGVATMNRKVSQVVTDIANQFGYTPVLNMEDGSDVLAGAQYGSTDHAYMTIPQNLWEILNTLARDTGNEVYTTPDRRLVFGTPGAGLPTINLSWNSPALDTTNAPLPCANLHVTHNPLRNSTFRVVVTSYFPGTATATIGRATYVANNLATAALPEGLYVGSAAKQADQQLLNQAKTDQLTTGGGGGELSHVQIYTFHWDGLTNDDANSRAAAIAQDISKRLLVLDCTIDGLPTLTPTQKFTLTGPMPSEMSGNTWYVTGFRHVFRLPPPGAGAGWTGYVTEIRGLDLPNNALAPKGVAGNIGGIRNTIR